jgi:hypothetical protein
MAGKIFINYRRGDDPGNTGRLFDRLQDAFQSDQLFMDVDSIKPGLDFVRVLEEQVAQCDVLLAVIGKDWIDARDNAGARRLDNPDDFVRIEIESALKQDKRVIPVLMHEARMPRAEELPEAIRPLARRNAVRLTHERFRADAAGLIKALQQTLDDVEAVHRARAEAARRAQADEQRKKDEEATRQRAEAQRLVHEQARQAVEQARLAAIAGLSAEQIAKAEELANWDFIKESSLPHDFRDHLTRFPDGVSARMALHKLEALAWAELGHEPSREALASYLAEYPAGVHSEPARAKLAALERAEVERTVLRRGEAERALETAKREDRAAAIADFLATYTDNDLIAEAHTLHAALLARDEAHEKAMASDSPAVLRAFLDTYPLGSPADEVRRKLERLEGPAHAWRRRDGLIATSCFVVVLLCIAAVIWVSLPERAVIEIKSGVVNSVAFGRGGRLASAEEAKVIKIWDAMTGRLERTLIGHEGYDVYSVAFSPDGKWIVSGANDTVALWDTSTGQIVRKFGTKSAGSVAFSPDSNWIASGSADAKIWDVGSGKLLRTFVGVAGSVAFSPDGKRLAAGGSDQLIKIWDTQSGDLVRTLGGFDTTVWSVAFSPDGKWLASGDNNGALKIWDATSLELVHTLTWFRAVWAIAFSPDGKWAASANFDSSVVVWETAGWTRVRTLTPKGSPQSVAFSPDGKWIATSGHTTVEIWKAP